MTKEELRKSLDFVCEERERLHNEKEELQLRIDKAIEYIKENSNAFGVIETIHNGVLLNILRGEDK